jgi:hypothetical protein
MYMDISRRSRSRIAARSLAVVSSAARCWWSVAESKLERRADEVIEEGRDGTRRRREAWASTVQVEREGDDELMVTEEGGEGCSYRAST